MFKAKAEMPPTDRRLWICPQWERTRLRYFPQRRKGGKTPDAKDAEPKHEPINAPAK
jgi:hypothetical protein